MGEREGETKRKRDIPHDRESKTYVNKDKTQKDIESMKQRNRVRKKEGESVCERERQKEGETKKTETKHKKA